MPNLTNLSPKGADGQAVTFEPLEIKSGGTAVFAARPNGSVFDQLLNTFFTRHSVESSEKTLVTDTLTVPVIRSVDGVATQVDRIIIKTDMRFPDICTASEREQALALHSSKYNATDCPELVAIYRDLKHWF
jgi:hypothetical protein